MVKRGYELIHEGRTRDENGKRTKYISRFYKCTSCHNTVREEKDLSQVDPDKRLQYAKEKDIPYLQGSTFWGIVNRETWYNDDYVLKYGSLVEKAENSLIESTQLCAQVCSQGRWLEEWEMNNILAYYWSLQMKMEDLDFSEKELEELKNVQAEKAIAAIKAKYSQKSPATFGHLPKDKEKGYAFAGDPEKGKVIYENGCQHCHRERGESDVVLDNSSVTFKWLNKNITANSKLSIYDIIRLGTYAEKGHKEYMPHYTEEKMSDEQIEDLRAYIEKMAE
ncbi:MAG: cytochrome c [Flavobacteriales bacterium]|nr:cytochrome c [Flavobacteriales bacterium]